MTPDGIVTDDDGVDRCWWGASTPDYAEYHDREWGRPVDDDQRLFEKICLEGFQSGLSWLTILRSARASARAFHGFDFERVARSGRATSSACSATTSIIRHRGKIEATINNARRALDLVEECGSLAAYAWGFEPDPATRPSPLTKAALFELTTTPESVALSKDLKKRGWRFFGPTTAYAFMQAMGLVNDHLEGCHARPIAENAREAFVRPATLRDRR